MMLEDDIKVNWYYFCSLAKQLHNTVQFVDHSVDSNGNLINGLTFSNEFAKLLMLSSSEFEVVAKLICSELGVSLSWNANILSVTREIINAFPKIGETVIVTPYQSIKPLSDWKIVRRLNRNGNEVDIVDGISWWTDYNSIKHNRRMSFYSANLKNCIYSTASLLVLELYLSRLAIGNIDEISSIRCDYFNFSYGLSKLVVDAGNYLPDYNIITD